LLLKRVEFGGGQNFVIVGASRDGAGAKAMVTETDRLLGVVGAKLGRVATIRMDDGRVLGLELVVGTIVAKHDGVVVDVVVVVVVATTLTTHVELLGERARVVIGVSKALVLGLFKLRPAIRGMMKGLMIANNAIKG